MARKVLFIIFLISLLIGFFYYKPLFERNKPTPSIIDRLPSGEFIGKVKILEVAKESSGMMFYNKVPFRDFLAPEFLLAQGKGYGLDIQKPAYFFVNSEDEWGALVEVSDSSKIRSGIERLRKNIDLEDTMVSQQRVYLVKSERLYLTYDKKWLFIYKGTQLPKRLYHVMFAEKNEMKRSWKAFLKESQFSNENLVVYSNSKKLKAFGIETAIFAHDSDSTAVRIKTYIRNSKSLGISKKASGLGFVDNNAKDKLINLHLNIEKLRDDKDDPIYKILKDLSRKISFPLDAFLKAWEGDISFHQGGTVKVNETFVETIMDENFELTEVKSTQQKEVPGFSFLMSCNEYHKDFLNQLFSKGIIRKNGNKYYLLTSPPLKIMQTPTHFYLYSAAYLPKTAVSDLNGGHWRNDKGVQYGFSLDSISRHELFGTVTIPVERFLKKKKKLLF